MPPKSSSNKSKAPSKLDFKPTREVKPIEIDDDGRSPEPRATSIDKSNGKSKEKAEHDDTISEAYSEGSHSVDYAALDEEETPTTGTTGWRGGGYNAIKDFNGQIYSGMAIGGSHTWNYQPGVWKETKVEPDKWEIDFQTNKVRNHKAPVNSGAPVGTEYHWYIVAHQMVKKIDANTYETHLTGSKYKLAHKNVNAKNWDIPTVKGQREREIFLLEDAKRRIEGLPPVLSTDKIKVDKKEKGQATLGNFFQASPSKKRKRSPNEHEEYGNSSSKKGVKAEKNGV